MLLDWRPQEAYADFFYTDRKEIIARRTVFRDEIDFFVPYGGRGSAKTWTFADAVVVEGAIRPVRVLVTRELQLSIEESIKEEIEEAIEARGIGHFYDIKKQKIYGANGTEFIFKGLKNNISNLKSIANVDIVLCEESDKIIQHSWDKLLPSIRPRNKVHRGGRPIVIVIFNPDDEYDDTYTRFVVNPPPRTIAKLINFDQNKYFPKHLDDQRIHFKKTRPLRDYEHEWEGKPTGAGGDPIIDLEWIKAARFASRVDGFKHVGDKVVAYDPSGQGKDFNAVVFADGNIIKEVDEWLKSPDLREATGQAFGMALRNDAALFRFDTCGGLGDGVEVFVTDLFDEFEFETRNMEVAPFDAGGKVIDADDDIPGTGKTWGEMYTNAKAQAHGILAQLLYNSYRFVVLGEMDIAPEDLLSIDIEDDEVFIKLATELKTPLWIKSNINSKKLVEPKDKMKKRTGQPSGNIGDCIVQIYAPVESGGMLDLLKAVVGEN